MKTSSICALLIIFSIVGTSYAQETEYKGIQQKLLGVGSEFDENGNGFDIDYILEGQLENTVEIDPASKSITFEYDSKGIDEDVLIIFLPQGLIDEPLGVYINDVSRLVIPVFEDSKEIKIVGTQVIPEFSIVLPILILTIIFAVFLGRSKFNRFSHSRF